MDLNKLKSILDSAIPEEAKRYSVLKVMAADEQAIPDMLEILDHERKTKKELLKQINFQLSRAHVALEMAKFDKNGLNGDGFIQREILQFYFDNREVVGHCFKDIDKITTNNQ